MLSDNPIWLLCNNIWSVEELSLVRTKNVEENDAGLHLRKKRWLLKNLLLPHDKYCSNHIKINSMRTVHV
jgi:hypothetical protein